MDLYHQIFDPTQVTRSLSCHFIDEHKEHLIVSKGTLIQIFEILRSSMKLKLVTEYKLQGAIAEMRKIRTRESKLDYLLITFKRAKTVLLKWDNYRFEVMARSLHYYEQFLANITNDNDDNSQIAFKVDPNNQCAVLHYKDSLCFLPFIQEEEEEEGDQNMDEYEPNSAATLAKSDITAASFILAASKLDKLIRNIVDITFLHNYNEPTLAVLFQPEPTWSGSLPLRKDTTRLLVLSLDLANKTSTAIIDVDHLPYDTFQLKELAKPIDGLLLIGCNQLIHVNPNGGCSGVGVNEYYKDCTNFKLEDSSSLNLKLENSYIGEFFNDRLLLIEGNTNEIYTIQFPLSKRKAILFEKIYFEDEALSFTKVNSLTLLQNNLVFVACDGSDSLLLHYNLRSNEKQAALTQDESNDEAGATDGTADNNEDMDIYSDDTDTTSLAGKEVDIQHLKFEVKDTLPNYGPITNFAMAQPSANLKVLGLPNPNYKENCIVASTGHTRGSSISVVNPTIRPIVKSCLKFSNVNRIWTVNDSNGRGDYLVTTNFDNYKTEIFKINDNYKKFFTADFNGNEITLFLTKFNNDKILQVTTTAIKLYDYNFHILTTLTFEVEIVFGYSFNDLILITFQDGEVASFELKENDVLSALRDFKKFESENKKKRSKEIKEKLAKMRKEVKDLKKYELSKIQLPKLLNDLIITTGTIVVSSLLNNVRFGGVKRDHDDNPVNEGEKVDSRIPLFVLITADNRILLFRRDHGEKIFELNGAENLSQYLTIGLMIVNKEGVPDPQIKSITVCELGDVNDKEEYLVILTVGGQIILYKLFDNGSTNEFFKINELATLKMTGAPENAYPSGTKIERNLIPFENLSGLNCVLVTGVKTYCIMKTARSLPKVHQFTNLNSVSMASFSNDKVSNGLMFIDDHKSARIVELDPKQDLSNRLPITKYSKLVSPDETIKSIEYHKFSNTFVISCFKEVDYDAIDENGNPIYGVDKSKTLRGKTFKSSVKLVSPMNWSVIDEVELGENELALTARSMHLDISKTHTGIKKEFIVVGSAKVRTEDLASNGSFKILEIISIIPEPGRPETSHKFKSVFEEDTKGAVTALTEVSGRILTAQGPKLLVRDLQDDNTVMPVAFYDTSAYVTDVKTFEDLIVVSDTAESAWLLGFDAEPYRCILLGKDQLKLDVQCVDFIVYDKQLYILVADSENVLHLLQYDPDDPTSQMGQRLIRKSIFKLNSKTTALKRFHKFEEFDKNSGTDKFQCIGTNLDGSIYKVTPIAESSYRNFYIIQQQIIDKEYTTFGLNPKMNRHGELPMHLRNCLSVASTTVSRPILDFDVVRSFLNLNDDKRRNIGNKIGKNVSAEVYRDFIDLERTI